MYRKRPVSYTHLADKEISVYSVNGKSDDVLLYKNHEGKPFNVIVIGGDKLSRGLTLEGLTVSYFTRSSNTYLSLIHILIIAACAVAWIEIHSG